MDWNAQCSVGRCAEHEYANIQDNLYSNFTYLPHDPDGGDQCCQRGDHSLSGNSGLASDVTTSLNGSLIYKSLEHLELYASAKQGLHSNDARGTTISLDPVPGEPVDRVEPHRFDRIRTGHTNLRQRADARVGGDRAPGPGFGAAVRR